MTRPSRKHRLHCMLGLALAAGVFAADAPPVMAQQSQQQPAATQPAAASQPAEQSRPRRTGSRTSRAAAPATTQPAASHLIGAPRPWSHYQVIAQRNLFTRGSSESSRPRPTNPSGEEGRGGNQTRPAASWVLTGLVVRDDQSVAFFENSASGMTLRVTPGQSVGDLELDTIAADHVVVKTAQGPKQVFIGATVDGRPATLSNSGGSIFGDADSVAPSGNAQGGGSSGTTLTPEAEMSVIERMRARRARESGGR